MGTKDIPFGIWLLNLLEKKDWNRSILARKIGVRPNTVARWISGDRQPEHEHVIAAADILGVDRNEFLRRAGYTPTYSVVTKPVAPEEVRQAMQEVADRFTRYQPSTNPQTARVRVLNAISAGESMSHDRQIAESIDVPLWMLDGVRPEDAAILVVTGDCLRGGDDIRSGDRVIIDTTIRVPENGEIVAVRVNGEETLKHYHQFGDRVELRPSTEGYIPIVVYQGQGDVEIIGVYAGMLRRARRGGR